MPPSPEELGPQLRCSGCNKLLAEHLLAGLIRCPRCAQVNVRLLIEPEPLPPGP